MQETIEIIKRKAAALKHYYMWHYASKQLKLVLVSEFPKSGGTWLCQMLSDYLEIPFPRNKIPSFEKSILHGHNFYSDAFYNPVYLIRDGRDVMVSFYHHRYLGHNLIPAFVLEKTMALAPFKNFENIKDNMPAFIEYIFTSFTVSGKKMNWKNLTESYLEKQNVTFVKYEDLLKCPFSEMKRIIQALTVDTLQKKKLEETIDKFSFQNQAKRRHGEESKNSFLRKGIAQDWKNNFTREACEVFNYYAGDMLIQLGYEENTKWIDNKLS
jgi:hypothetical protein